MLGVYDWRRDFTVDEVGKRRSVACSWMENGENGNDDDDEETEEVSKLILGFKIVHEKI